MKALDKPVHDEECDIIQQQLKSYTIDNGVFCHIHAIKNQKKMTSRVIEHVWQFYPTAAAFGNMGASIGCDTSSEERC